MTDEPEDVGSRTRSSDDPEGAGGVGGSTLAPTLAPTVPPTLAPTAKPSLAPIEAATANPTLAPTVPPTLAPTAKPSLAPTPVPTLAPVPVPAPVQAQQVPIPVPVPVASPTLAPTPRPSFDRSPVANLWAGGECDPHMALKSCPAEKFKMYFSRSVSKSAWASTNTTMQETSGQCINKADATRVPPGFTGSITTTKGGTYLAKTWRNQTDRLQSWVFKWSYRHCYVIEAATKLTNGACLMTHQTNISELCEELQYSSPGVNIARTEIIFGCCDLAGDGNVTVDVGDVRYADEGTQDGGNKTTKFGDDAERKACETYQYNNLTECTGPFCQATQTCSLRRGLQQLRFDSWPAVPEGEREEVIIQVMIIDTGEIYNFTHNTTGFPGKAVNGTTPDNFFIRPSFYVENQATFNALYNAQYRDGIAMQFFSTRRGPGGWNSCIFSPIGIDIHRTGAVQMIEGNFSINIDGNTNTSTGFEEGDEYLNFWFGPQVGILIHDPPNAENGTSSASGEITGKHLIGDMGGQYADGYAKLATFDANQGTFPFQLVVLLELRVLIVSFHSHVFCNVASSSDGEINGAELDKFHIWTDTNSNAHMDAGELHSLEQFEIVSLYTMHDCRKSRAVLEDGTEILTEDLWFSRRRR
jgi:hypothetical protein